MIYVGNKKYSLYVENKRREMIIPESLPYDAELEYLESTGTQYIQIDTPITNVLFMEYEVSYSNGNTTTVISTLGGTAERACINYYNQYNVCIWRGANADYIRVNPQYNVFYTVSHDFRGTSDIVVWNSTEVLNKEISTSLTSQGVAIFADLSLAPSKGKVKWIRITSPNDDLLYDLIPVRIGTTGYLYDKVSGQLFGNAGTGDFVLGPDKAPSILPSGYTQMLGVKNTSTAYLPAPTINAGVRYELEIEATNGFGNGLFSYNSTGTYEIIVFFNGSSDSYLNGKFTLEGFSFNTKFKIVLDLAMESEYARLYINDELVRQTALHVNIGSDIGIFKDLRRNTYVKGILYSFRGYKDDVLINDYIPAIRNSDGKVGVYDIASNEFILSPNDVDFEAVLQ